MQLKLVVADRYIIHYTELAYQIDRIDMWGKAFKLILCKVGVALL